MDRILIPTDFSAVAGNALAHGLELARGTRHRVSLLHICDEGGTGSQEEPAGKGILAGMQAHLLKFNQTGVKIETLVRKGNLFKTVNAVSAELAPALMVLGTHGKQGLQHLFGSYALRMVLDAPCPVLVVHDRPFGKGYRKIMVPVTVTLDGTVLTAWLRRFARLFSPEITILRPYNEPERDDPFDLPVSEMARTLKKLKLAYSVEKAPPGTGFARQVTAGARARRCDLIMAMSLPDTEATGYSLAEWTERLMFNPYRLPVLFSAG